MKKTKILLLLFIFSFFAFACARPKNISNVDKSMQIKGSDTVVNLVQVWAERFVEDKKDVNIGVTGGGSGTGFAALINSTCDIAMSSRKIEDKEREQASENGVKPNEFIVGLDGLVILVNKSNRVENLTMEQLRDIFMKRIKNWKEVGGDDLEIVILSRESNSGTHMFFKEHVLRRGDAKSIEEFSPSSLLMPSSQAIYDEIYQNPHAIGYVGIGFVNDEVKVLKIAKKDGAAFIYPNVDTVLDGTYPISRPLYLYTNGAPKGIVKEFIDYTLSDIGQKIVLEIDFVPLKKIN